MAKLASLVVDLQLQSAQLRAGLDEANRKLDAFAKQTEQTGNIIAGALSFDFLKDGFVSLATFVKGGADAADSMGELAQAVGVPVEALSRLSYAATFSGSSTEAVGKALAKTGALMAKALEPASEQAALLQALGISATEADGRLRAADAVFADIAQRFSETSDGAGKTALAIKLFGEEGAKLVPLLNNGKAGLAKFAEEAARTGNVITEKGAASAGDFNDALDRLAKAGEGLALRVAQELAPSMAAFAEALTTSKGSTEAFTTAADGLAFALRGLASGGVIVAASFETLGVLLAGVASALVNVIDGDFRAAQASLKAEGEALLGIWKEEGKRLNAIWKKDGPGAAMASDAEKAKPSADQYVTAIERTKKAAEKAAEAQKRLAEAARKAEEERLKSMEEAFKAALSLERQQEAIDRAAEKRRSDYAGVSATDGFADFEDALSRMAEAQKSALAIRATAAEREKRGDVLGADMAAREADEVEAFAERASSAADAFADSIKKAGEDAAKALEDEVAERIKAEEKARKELEEALAKMPEDLLGMLKPSGPAFNAVTEGVTTGAAAGPVGAVVGGLVGLLSQSETFQGALGELESIFQALANSVGLLVEPLLPLLSVVSEVAAGLGALLGALSPIVEFVAAPLFEVLKGFGMVVLGLVKMVGEIINGIGEALGFKNKLDLSGVDAAMVRLEKSTYESAKAQQEQAEAVQRATESVANVPSWYRVEMTRFNATEPGRPGAAGGSTTVTDNSRIDLDVNGVTDPVAVANLVIDRLEKRKGRTAGNRYSDDTDRKP